MPQYTPKRDSVDKLFTPSDYCRIELMIHDYAMDFGLDPLEVEKRDLFLLEEHWAIQNNKNAPSNYRNDNPKQ